MHIHSLHNWSHIPHYWKPHVAAHLVSFKSSFILKRVTIAEGPRPSSASSLLDMPKYVFGTLLPKLEF